MIIFFTPILSPWPYCKFLFLFGILIEADVKVGGLMEANFKQIEDVLFVDLKGRVNIESCIPFRRMSQKLAGKKIIFNFKNLSFVGSHGIIPLLNTLGDFEIKFRANLKFCSVSSEFQKILASSPINHVEIYESENVAFQAFLNERNKTVAANGESTWIDSRVAEPAIQQAAKVQDFPIMNETLKDSEN